MVCVYTRNDSAINNRELLELAAECQIEPDNVVIGEPGKDKLSALIARLGENDTLMVQSVAELAGAPKELQEVMSELEGKKVELMSIKEPCFNGFDYAQTLHMFVQIDRYYREKNRKKGYKKAVKEKKVGRPKLKKETEKALKLYDTKNFSIPEITELTGVSSSTLYRALKERKTEKR